MSASSDAPQPRSVDDRGDAQASLSRDKIFHILQTQRRRDALRYLKANEGPVEMRALAEQVAAWENDTTVAALSSDERQRVYIALYQSHLPKLDEEGVIDYNQSRGIVERGSLADQFDPYLDVSNDEEGEQVEPAETETRWLDYYRHSTAAGIVVVLLSWLGVPPMTVLETGQWGALVVAAFGLLSLAHVALGDQN
ncbi:hypothetical protein DMJ13_11915 [halophilic archaeon]|nr:hypothetical protein DMJ13_11915 [halophilic archaeon]